MRRSWMINEEVQIKLQAMIDTYHKSKDAYKEAEKTAWVKKVEMYKCRADVFQALRDAGIKDSTLSQIVSRGGWIFLNPR